MEETLIRRHKCTDWSSSTRRHNPFTGIPLIVEASKDKSGYRKMFNIGKIYLSKQHRAWPDSSFRSSLVRVCTICHHVFIFRTHYCIVKLNCFNFKTITIIIFCVRILRGWSGGAMVLGKLPVPGRPTIWITVGQGPTALAVGAGGGCLDIFTLIYPFFSLSPSLWETARYRLKYCLKGPLNPKQPTNQPMSAF